MVNFECRLCNFEELYEDGLAPFRCPECGTKWYRLRYLKEPKEKREFVNIGFKDNPRLSWALGCSPEQLPAKMKQHPGAEFVKAKGGGYQMLIKNRTEKKRRMKEAGLHELN